MYFGSKTEGRGTAGWAEISDVEGDFGRKSARERLRRWEGCGDR